MRISDWSSDVCSSDLYRKRRANGASIMYNVEVFPLAVTNELDDWKEMDERDRKWFSFSDAASAVDEPDLQALIRSFGASGFRAVAQPRDVVQNMSGKTGVSRMLAWFQRLLPRKGKIGRAHVCTQFT